jgi:hypothetical protein
LVTNHAAKTGIVRGALEQYLLAVAAKIPRLDQPFEPTTPDFVGISYSDNPQELGIILSHLEQQGLVTASSMSRGTRQLLLPMNYAQEGLHQAKHSLQCGSQTK